MQLRLWKCTGPTNDIEGRKLIEKHIQSLATPPMTTLFLNRLVIQKSHPHSLGMPPLTCTDIVRSTRLVPMQHASESHLFQP